MLASPPAPAAPVGLAAATAAPEDAPDGAAPEGAGAAHPHRVTVVVDTRETKLRGLIAGLAPREHLHVEVAQLPLGDVHYYVDDASEEGPMAPGTVGDDDAADDDNDAAGAAATTTKASRLAFVVERKSVRDLAASHRDGRLASQARRLRACGLPPSRVLLLVEGRWAPSRRHGLTAADLQRVVCDVMLSTGFHVYHVGGLAETATLLERLAEGVRDARLSAATVDAGIAAPRMRHEGGGGGGGRRRGRRRRAAAVTTTTAHEVARTAASQLYAIPAVSQRIALAVAKAYPSLRALVAAYEAYDEALAANDEASAAAHPLDRVRVPYARGERGVPEAARRSIGAHLGFGG
jgi:ERCC4-type nuclease